MTAAAFALFPMASPAQDSRGEVCTADARMQEAYGEHPHILEAHARLEEFTARFRKNRFLGKSAPTAYLIPIVFHVNHPTTPEKVTMEQIQSAMQILNEDYNAANSDFASIGPLYKPIAANLNIQFALAKRDPQGNPTTGVVYYKNTYCGRDSKLKTTSSWPPKSYLNIWIVDDVECNGADNNSGWAYLPSTSLADQKVDGIVYNFRYLGRKGVSQALPGSINFEMARVLTHEIGHYLNLQHTFYGFCSSASGDNVGDTPPVQWNNGTRWCPASPEKATDNHLSCDKKTVVNYENYMDYSDCTRMFTEGQKTRMIAALNSPEGYRNNLYASANLSLVGLDNWVSTREAARPADAPRLLAAGDGLVLSMPRTPYLPPRLELLDIRGRPSGLLPMVGMTEMRADYSLEKSVAKGVYFTRVPEGDKVRTHPVIIP
jgi:hypothetical protein